MSKAWYVVGILIVLALSLGLPYWLAQRGLKELTPDVRKGLPGKFVKLSDGFTCYEWKGPETGPIVVLVHGATQSRYIWDNAVPALVSAGFRVLCYDSFGRGYSDRPDVVYGLDLYDRQLAELLKALNVNGPVNLVGLSQGGGIAVVFTARHPDLVRKLVLCAPVGFPMNLSFAAKLTKAPLIGEWMMTVFGKQILVAGTGRDFTNKSAIPEIKKKLAHQLVYKGYLPSLLSMLRNYPMDDLADIYAEAAKHHIPTLLLWGDADKTVPLANADKVRGAMPYATLEVVPGGSHSTVYEGAEKSNPILVRFLSD